MVDKLSSEGLRDNLLLFNVSSDRYTLLHILTTELTTLDEIPKRTVVIQYTGSPVK